MSISKRTEEAIFTRCVMMSLLKKSPYLSQLDGDTLDIATVQSLLGKESALKLRTVPIICAKTVCRSGTRLLLDKFKPLSGLKKFINPDMIRIELKPDELMLLSRDIDPRTGSAITTALQNCFYEAIGVNADDILEMLTDETVRSEKEKTGADDDEDGGNGDGDDGDDDDNDHKRTNDDGDASDVGRRDERGDANMRQSPELYDQAKNDNDDNYSDVVDDRNDADVRSVCSVESYRSRDSRAASSVSSRTSRLSGRKRRSDIRSPTPKKTRVLDENDITVHRSHRDDDDDGKDAEKNVVRGKSPDTERLKSAKELPERLVVPTFKKQTDVASLERDLSGGNGDIFSDGYDTDSGDDARRKGSVRIEDCSDQEDFRF